MRDERTLALLLQRAFGGMARLEALLVLLGGAAMVVRLHCDGCHVAAAACFESEGNRRHFAGELSESLGCARLAIEVGEIPIILAPYR
jgi:hypothetical protein